MSRSTVAVSLLGTSLVLAGCSIFSQEAAPDSPPGAAVKPVSATRHGIDHAGAYYALGRYYQGQVRYDEAVRSYRQVLEAQPDHADAHNALGVIYAIRGQHAEAEKELRTAASLAPGAAHIHNNLGYALLQQGRVDEAIPAFESALRLDPGHGRAADNLRKALASLEAAPRPVANEPRQEPAPPAGNGPGIRVAAVTDNIYELRRPATPSPARTETAVVAVPAAMPLAAPIRLEVANGNGVEGLARRTSGYLRNAGYGPTRLTNQKPYSLPRTEIQYRPGFESQAQRLQATLAGKGVIVLSSQMRQDIQLRLVLGKDLRTMEQLAEIEKSAPLRLARNGQ